MSIDMSQFYQVFFEETAEHLASMESLLLALDVGAPDPDQLNAIFRAAHSIKGSSGTFGFTDLTEVTHELETLLDRIRKNEITITADMVDSFLRAGDVLRGLLAAHQNGSAIDAKASIEIRAKLEHLAAEGSPRPGAKAAPTGAQPKAGGGLPTFGVPLDGAISQPGQMAGSSTRGQHPPGVSVESSSAPAQHVYEIEFANTPAAFPGNTHLNNLLEDLGNIGKIENKKIAANTVTLSLSTYASEAELRDIFSFFLNPGQLTISAKDATSQSPAEKPFDEAQDRLLAGHPNAQDYGFFVEPEAVKAGVEHAQGYGFFVEPEAVKAGVEHAQGYGFFVEPEAVKVGVEDAQGYGFFVDVEKSAQRQAPLPGVRRDDVPGRRTTDNAGIATAGDTSIRVSVGKVDQMINLVGELVITQAMLAEIISNMDPALHERLVNGLAQLERNTRDLQESVMSVRMMPIKLVFSRFHRVVRDGANKLSKKVQLKIVGEGTELDKGLIEKISDPLNHLVRNSLDHGIEPPNERIAKGKDPQGTITLRAAHQGGNIVIEVSDDGAGLNRERILAKARESGMSANDSMSDAEVWQMIFAPGFSTADSVTDVSGRGVGMDVVKRNIESIGGRVEINSQHGIGCAITIRLPLTLAILDGLSIAVGEQIYIIPLSFISESLQPNPEDIKEISGQGKVVHVRDEYLPLLALHQLFNIQTNITRPEEGILVLLETEGKKVALLVDELLGQHQVVIKSLETNYRKVAGVSGATIMGDGRVAMIMDVGALVKLAQQRVES